MPITCDRERFYLLLSAVKCGLLAPLSFGGYESDGSPQTIWQTTASDRSLELRSGCWSGYRLLPSSGNTIPPAISWSSVLTAWDSRRLLIPLLFKLRIVTNDTSGHQDDAGVTGEDASRSVTLADSNYLGHIGRIASNWSSFHFSFSGLIFQF